MGTAVDFEIGITLSIRHGSEQSSLFEFQFELDIDELDSAGFGHESFFCFVYDVALGKVVEITSTTAAEVLQHARIHPDYDGEMGTEYVLKYEGKAGSGDIVYAYLSYERAEIDDQAFESAYDEISKPFFDICAQTLAMTKQYFQ